MKILHVEKQRQTTGQTLRALEEVLGLKKRGHELWLACQPGSMVGENAGRAGVYVVELPMSGVRLYASALPLRGLIRRERFDIVHAHGARDHQLAALAALGLRNVAVVRSKHNIVPLRRNPFSKLLYNQLTTKVIAVSQAAAAGLIDDGVRPEKIVVVKDGVDVRRFAPMPKSEGVTKELGLTADMVVIGAAGRLGSGSLDIITFVRAFAKLAPRYPTARLLLVGRGAETIAEKARELGIADRVILPGFREDMPEMLSVMDIYVQPNIKAGMQLAALEAMAMGLPVVATRVGGLPEAVLDGETGVLCPPSNPDALAEAIASLIEQPAKRSEMGEKGRQRMVALFDSERMVEQVERVYLELNRSA